MSFKNEKILAVLNSIHNACIGKDYLYNKLFSEFVQSLVKCQHVNKCLTENYET